MTIALLVSTICAILGAIIAYRKRRSCFGWAMGGFFLPALCAMNQYTEELKYASIVGVELNGSKIE